MKGRLADREDLIEGTQYASFGEDGDKKVSVKYYISEIKEKFEILQIYCIQRCCTERDFVDQYTTVRDLIIESIQEGFVEQILDGVKHE